MSPKLQPRVAPILLLTASLAAAAPAPSPAGAPRCDNEALTGYDALLVLAPHPDDETLAFAGLVTAYMRAGKPVEVVVVTDGDGYCDACRLWKGASMRGPMCGAADLSNLATPAADSFGEVRRAESVAAAAILGRQPPRFLGYPDTGIAAALANLARGEPRRALRRSDFSRCADCESCQSGYGGGPETELTGASLEGVLRSLLAATGERTLVATTHRLDGHGDHAALGALVRSLDAALPRPRPLAFAVVHAKTANGTAHPDCWYPGPRALVCPCLLDEARALGDPTWVADLRRHRSRPDLPAALPDDAPYGEARHLCLPEDLVAGPGALKAAAVAAYRSQLGTVARDGVLPAGLEALTDCSGYLAAFVRGTEVFVLEEPAAAAASSGAPLSLPGARERVRDALRRAADWQLAHVAYEAPLPDGGTQPVSDTEWVRGAFFAGVMAAHRATGERRFLAAALALAEKNRWRPGPRPRHADDLCIAQTYAELYRLEPDPERLAATVARLDAIVADRRPGPIVGWREDDNWSWCDALFMAPPTMAMVAEATGDRRYLDALDASWWETSAYLYDETEHLYYRDGRYPPQPDGSQPRTAGGRKVFWSRGNGWVLAGLARVLEHMPADHPSRPRYERQMREMAARLVSLQGADGFWRSSLLDPAEYPAPESSGTGFFAYGLAWGINHGVLDRAAHLPAVESAWQALVGALHPSGKLGWVQQIGYDPRSVGPDDSQEYGAGAFLLAGSEILALAAP